jgi:membrane-associated protease RseP (regulator of RpoE activity)
MVDTGDQKIEYQRDADGHVKVTVTKNGDTETYRAGSLDALKDSNPDVYDLVRKHFEGGMIGIGRFPALPVPQPLHRLDMPPTGEPPLPAAGFRLGVWVGEMSDALRYHLDLGEGQGLLVESVVEGSLAEKIGVRHFDVIVKVNGTPVGSAADVAKALADVPEGGQVKVEVIRQGKPLDLVGTR